MLKMLHVVYLIIINNNNHIVTSKQLTERYPDVLTPDNIWIIGITQEPSTCDYYLVFYHEIHQVLKRVIRMKGDVKFFQYSEFGVIEEIGAGGYGTVYRAECESIRERVVVLKRFKRFDWMPELFISEVSSN
jgi:hypothetical protein